MATPDLKPRVRSLREWAVADYGLPVTRQVSHTRYNAPASWETAVLLPAVYKGGRRGFGVLCFPTAERQCLLPSQAPLAATRTLAPACPSCTSSTPCQPSQAVCSAVPPITRRSLDTFLNPSAPPLLSLKNGDTSSHSAWMAGSFKLTMCCTQCTQPTVNPGPAPLPPVSKAALMNFGVIATLQKLRLGKQ